MEPMQGSSPGAQSVRRRQQKAMRKAARPHPYAKEQKMTDATTLPLINAPSGESRGQMLQRYLTLFRFAVSLADLADIRGSIAKLRNRQMHCENKSIDSIFTLNTCYTMGFVRFKKPEYCVGNG